VLVQPDLYIENVNFNGHKIVLGSLYLTTGDESYIATTIIDGDSSGSAVTFENGEDITAIIKGFTITNGNAPEGGGIFCMNSNPVITNNIITLNICNTYGAGIYCYYANPVVSYNEIYDNTVIEQFGRGGGIYCGMAEPFIKNNLVYNNSSAGMGGGISCANGGPILINNVFYGNIAGGGGGIYGWLATPTIRNCIFWADMPYEILMAGSSYPDIAYSDIEGNWPGIGNIDIFPLFRDPANNDFHLMSTFCGDPYDSPCIDVGDPTIQDYLLDCDWGLGSQLSDMGAYGGGDSTLQAIEDGQLALPEEPILFPSYPNPFNSITNIEFTLSKQSSISFDIYDILGREVESIYDGTIAAGAHAFRWDAGNYPSGVYFAKLKLGDYSKNIKMLLLK
jgi:hypothetical protein